MEVAGNGVYWQKCQPPLRLWLVESGRERLA